MMPRYRCFPTRSGATRLSVAILDGISLRCERKHTIAPLNIRFKKPPPLPDINCLDRPSQNTPNSRRPRPHQHLRKLTGLRRAKQGSINHLLRVERTFPPIRNEHNTPRIELPHPRHHIIILSLYEI